MPNQAPQVLVGSALDADFHGDGLLVLDFPLPGSAEAFSLEIQPDGRYLLAGHAGLDGQWAFGIARVEASGDLDTGFSGDGFQTLQPGTSSDYLDMVLQPDGKIVLAGDAEGQSSAQSAVIRLDAQGAPDPSFAGDGVLLLPVAGADGYALSNVVLQTDGKLLAAGQQGTHYALIRLDGQGNPDPAFAQNGQYLEGGFSADAINSEFQTLALRTDGGSIVAGQVVTSSGQDMGVAWHTATGELDTRFNGDGRATFSLSAGYNHETVLDIAPLKDGKILLAGRTSIAGNADAVLIQLDATGNLDASFGGGDGIAILDLSDLDHFNSVVVQADGSILAAGFANITYGEALIARFHANGELDTEFADHGVLTTLFSRGTSEIHDIALDQAGRLVAVGASYESGPDAFAMLRLDDGIIDQTAQAGSAFSYTVPLTAFHDPDGDGLSFTASLANGAPLPDWLAFDTASRTFSGTPTDAKIGHLDITITASDGTAAAHAEWNLDIGAPYIDALLGSASYRWNDDRALGQGVELSFGFRTTAPAYAQGAESTTFQPLGEGARQAARLALEAYADFSGLVFREAAAGEEALLMFSSYQDPTDSAAAYAYYPSRELPEGGDAWINRSYFLREAPQPGDYEFDLLLHEIGHALGLKHPGDYGENAPPYLDPAVESTQYTVMSYNDREESIRSGVYASTPMLYDMAAIQYLYGANPATRSGDDLYVFTPDELTYRNLWDAGGTDVIDLSAYVEPCVLDLREGQFSSLPGVVPNRAWMGALGTDNLSIARGSQIENAIGGQSSDTLIGNDLNNRLVGGTGLDRLIGGRGDDTYVIDILLDSITELPDEGIDTVESDISWTLRDNLENLILTGTGNRSGTGNLLDNHLTGNTGNNTLNGGPGRDTLVGGPGNDTYVVDHRNDVALETSALDGVDTVRAGLSWTLSEHLENLVLTGLKKYSATGNTLNNTLTGNSAANTLNGGPGADTLIGDAGNDTYVVDNAGDVIQETRTSATEIDTVRASLHWTLGANLENLVLTGAKHLSGTGNSLNNSLFGNSGNNLLNAGDGNDLLNGDSGADTLTGGAGADTFAFSAALAVSNVDTITDFSSGADKIQLSAYLFSQIGFTGAPASDAFFHNGANAMDSDDRILYDASNGSLYYDADGTGALAAVKFAVLSGAPTLLYSDFLLLA